MSLSNMISCLTSPKLFRIYKNRTSQTEYEPTGLEKVGDQLLTSLNVALSISLYFSPVIAFILYKRGFFTPEGGTLLLKFFSGLGAVYVASYAIRSMGRSQNSQYLEFLKVLAKAQDRFSGEAKSDLMQYDFEFSAWPVEFDASTAKSIDNYTSTTCVVPPMKGLSDIILSPLHLASYFALHTFGIRFIYPGSMTVLNWMMAPVLQQGRQNLLTENNGERFKLLTKDSHELDCMFVDKRNKTERGGDLVICTEGNAGFYEIGIMSTPLTTGQSVLGWNHPGFGQSTGMPYPAAEQAAMDSVIQFAVVQLGFKPSNIVLFGWSIGGYCSSYASCKYPAVKAVVLDATFDDILPVAIPRMPAFLSSLVELTIRSFADLTVAKFLVQYGGPVLLVRRTDDEIIALKPGDISTNRGNDLLVDLMKSRYPALFRNETKQALWSYLSNTGKHQNDVYTKYRVDDIYCQSILSNYTSMNTGYPYKNLGADLSSDEQSQMLLFLARKYMSDFKSTHCTPLPQSIFLRGV
uniref:Protein ABHD16A n=1 Tax=Cacopsylla melanoneura TaxID=428564 RepID=A0A8D8VIU4_9HEMI